MKMKAVRWMSLAVIAAVVSLGSFANASDHILTVEGQVALPGIDQAGNIDFGMTGEGFGSAAVNTRNGRVKLLARGTAPNASGKNYRLRTRDLDLLAALVLDLTGVDISNVGGIRLNKSLYTVKKNGNAKAVTKGRITSREAGAALAALFGL